MANAVQTSGDHTSTEIDSTMGSIKKMIVVSVLLAVVGYLLIILAGVEDAFLIWELADSSKMWLKLGGVGHILMGILISLIAIIRTLSLVPLRLSEQLG